jgi:hypothetical protein
VLDKGALVLEGVTLAQVVELVVKVLVDLASSTVADEQATENTHAAHPEDLAILPDKQSVKYFTTVYHPSRSCPLVERLSILMFKEE